MKPNALLKTLVVVVLVICVATSFGCSAFYGEEEERGHHRGEFREHREFRERERYDLYVPAQKPATVIAGTVITLEPPQQEAVD